jgi:hypothetical protein
MLSSDRQAPSPDALFLKYNRAPLGKAFLDFAEIRQQRAAL